MLSYSASIVISKWPQPAGSIEKAGRWFGLFIVEDQNTYKFFGVFLELPVEKSLSYKEIDAEILETYFVIHFKYSFSPFSPVFTTSFAESAVLSCVISGAGDAGPPPPPLPFFFPREAFGCVTAVVEDIASR